MRLCRKNLTRFGYEVTLAESGERAMHLLTEAQTKRTAALSGVSASYSHATAEQPLFDIILLDIIMPGMKGTEFLQKIKVMPPAWKDIPIIVMSSLDDPDTAVECMSLGADDVLTKPFNLELVKTRINARLEHVRLRSWVVSKLPALSAHAQPLSLRERAALADTEVTSPASIRRDLPSGEDVDALRGAAARPSWGSDSPTAYATVPVSATLSPPGGPRTVSISSSVSDGVSPSHVAGKQSASEGESNMTEKIRDAEAALTARYAKISAKVRCAVLDAAIRCAGNSSSCSKPLASKRWRSH
jgi:CheY-like chemotaxis protein